MYGSIRKHGDYVAAALGAACALALLPTPGFARDDADMRSVTVRYSDLDVDSPAGATALYSRLVRATRSVCGDETEIVDISQLKDIEACRKETLADAVSHVDRAMLTAVYDTHHAGELLAVTRGARRSTAST